LSIIIAMALAAVLSPAAPVGSDTTSRPALIVHHQPALPVVALRLSIQTDDPPGYAGAGHLLQHLVLAELSDQVERVGGRASIVRNSDALVYTVVGPALELDHLAAALLGALRAPAEDPGARLSAERVLRQERMAEWETAEGHARSALRAQLFPADLSSAGTENSVDRFSTVSLDALWGGVYDPTRTSVVAVGDVRTADVERAFASLPPSPRARLSGPRQDTTASRPLAAAEATRGWVAIGYPAVAASPATVSVGTRLLRDFVRQRLPGAQVEGEHWWTHHGQAMVLVASLDGDALNEGRRAVGTASGSLAGSLDEETVRAAATALRRDMLFYSRTPGRMAEVVGSFADRSGEPDAAQRYYDELGRVDAEMVRRFFEEIENRTPARVEIPPQPRRTP
jgi:predicted Zn-dependent peptidase